MQTKTSLVNEEWGETTSITPDVINGDARTKIDECQYKKRNCSRLITNILFG